MLELYAVNAEEGDSLILRFGPQGKQALLIDGGPRRVYRDSLRESLIRELRGHRIERVICSHSDDDHLIGLIEYLSELKEARDNDADDPSPPRRPSLEVGGVWHNAFEDTLGAELEPQLAAVAASLAAASLATPRGSSMLQGIRKGRKLAQLARILGLGPNPDTQGAPLVVGEGPQQFAFGDLELTLVGPTRSNLDKLRKEWKDWLQKQGISTAGGDFELAAMRDRSPRNLSSLQFHVRYGDTTLLLTGDGRGDHLLEGLQHAGLLKPDGSLHVDVFKVPHHGSDRNATRTFFETVTADTYVISANGKHDNPDWPVLQWIVESARARGRHITIVLTNRTSTTEAFRRRYRPSEWGYTLRVRRSNHRGIRVRLR